jgi:hypothetical protein
MNRRSFLSCIPLYPIGVRAFGPKTQESAQQPAQSGAIAYTPVQRIGRLYECVVGDLNVNANGHRYSKETWGSMFVSRGSFEYPPITLGGHEGPGVDLAAIAAMPVYYRFTEDDKIVVRIRIMETPKGQMFLSMLVPFFLTPDGLGHLRGEEVQDYNITQFRLSNSSAFDCATPLVPYADSKTDKDRTTTVRV